MLREHERRVGSRALFSVVAVIASTAALAVALVLHRRMADKDAELAELRRLHHALAQAQAESRDPRPQVVITGAEDAPRLNAVVPEQARPPEALPETQPSDPEQDDEPEERALRRAARVRAAEQQFAAQPLSGEEPRRTRALEAALDTALSGRGSEVSVNNVQCRGAQCSLDVAFPSGADVSQFNQGLREAVPNLIEDGNAPLLALITEPRDEKSVGHVYFEWRPAADSNGSAP